MITSLGFKLFSPSAWVCWIINPFILRSLYTNNCIFLQSSCILTGNLSLVISWTQHQGKPLPMGMCTARYHHLEFPTSLTVAEDLFQSLGPSFLVSGFTEMPSNLLRQVLLGAFLKHASGHAGQIVLRILVCCCRAWMGYYCHQNKKEFWHFW